MKKVVFAALVFVMSAAVSFAGTVNRGDVDPNVKTGSTAAAEPAVRPQNGAAGTAEQFGNLPWARSKNKNDAAEWGGKSRGNSPAMQSR